MLSLMKGIHLGLRRYVKSKHKESLRNALDRVRWCQNGDTGCEKRA